MLNGAITLIEHDAMPSPPAKLKGDGKAHGTAANDEHLSVIRSHVPTLAAA
jgi:hypothetical protein